MSGETSVKQVGHLICNGIFKNSFCIRWQCFKENYHGLKLIQVLPFSMCEFDCNDLHTAFVHIQC